MISYGKQTIDQTDIDAVLEVLKSDWLTQGPHVEAFENSLKSFFGAKYACAVSNGTAALHLAGIALGWKPGDIIITTPITFLATVNSIVYSGATPDFADIDIETYTIDPLKVEEKILYYKNKGLSIKAIIGVDFAGHPCDWKSLKELAVRYDLKLINDNCHALGSSYFGDKRYALKYADIVTQSYHPVKNITTGEGGAILTNDPEIHQKIKLLRSHGMEKNHDQVDNNGPWYYELHDIGYNYRITDFQCALGNNQLKRLDGFVKRRKQIAKKYDDSFFKRATLKPPLKRNFADHSYHLYPLRINFEKLQITKVQFFKEMKNLGINLQVHYIPVHLQPFYKKKYGFKIKDFPISERFYNEEVSIPIYPDLTNENIEFVIDSILAIIS